MYAGIGVGPAMRTKEPTSIMMSIHIGYQLAPVFIATDDSRDHFRIEYTQRLLSTDISPNYFGARICYGVLYKDFSVTSTFGYYLAIKNIDRPEQNGCVGGYGIQIGYKGYTLEYSKVQYRAITFGIQGFLSKIDPF